MRLYYYVYMRQCLKDFCYHLGGPSPYYMIIPFPSEKNECMKYKHRLSIWERNAVESYPRISSRKDIKSAGGKWMGKGSVLNGC
jgi:hypothetical protein